MSTNLTRTRVRGSNTPTTQAPEQSDDWYRQGEDGFATAERLQQGRKPFLSRFYLKTDQDAQIVLLDDGKGFFVHEYEIYDPARKRMSYETVNKDTGYDPLEQLVGVDPRFKDASYVMYLTCIDLTPYTDKNGNERYFSKKLLPVKRAQMKKFKRYLEQYGTYRGMMLRMTRDDPKSAKIGDPEPNPIDGKVVLTEEDILENFGGPAVLGQDRKTVVKPENADCYPYDYRTVLAPSPNEELAKRWGAPYNPGSQLANQQMVNNAQSTQARTAPAKTAGSPPPLLSKTRPKPAAVEEVEEEEVVEQKVKRPAVNPAKKTLVTKPAVVEAVEEDEIPFDEDEQSEDWYDPEAEE